eukprot:TRINITY_DN1030_c0_g2_i1.p1 TRINITY_DN1030_c0_g2~~TRINITY_DN1030_c0_g2_i1.p1  ORF type:complete len:586 (-),score=203.65 TRINITY_DN1030_c0_g2_i1:20-1777(-)
MISRGVMETVQPQGILLRAEIYSNNPHLNLKSPTPRDGPPPMFKKENISPPFDEIGPPPPLDRNSKPSPLPSPLPPPRPPLQITNENSVAIHSSPLPLQRETNSLASPSLSEHSFKTVPKKDPLFSSQSSNSRNPEIKLIEISLGGDFDSESKFASDSAGDMGEASQSASQSASSVESQGGITDPKVNPSHKLPIETQSENVPKDQQESSSVKKTSPIKHERISGDTVIIPSSNDIKGSHGNSSTTRNTTKSGNLLQQSTSQSQYQPPKQHFLKESPSKPLQEPFQNQNAFKNFSNKTNNHFKNFNSDPSPKHTSSTKQTQETGMLSKHRISPYNTSSKPGDYNVYLEGLTKLLSNSSTQMDILGVSSSLSKQSENDEIITNNNKKPNFFLCIITSLFKNLGGSFYLYDENGIVSSKPNYIKLLLMYLKHTFSKIDLSSLSLEDNKKEKINFSFFNFSIQINNNSFFDDFLHLDLKNGLFCPNNKESSKRKLLLIQRDQNFTFQITNTYLHQKVEIEIFTDKNVLVVENKECKISNDSKLLFDFKSHENLKDKIIQTGMIFNLRFDGSSEKDYLSIFFPIVLINI